MTEDSTEFLVTLQAIIKVLLHLRVKGMCNIMVLFVHQGSTTDHARHIAEYVVKLICDSHNVRLRRLLLNTKGPVILQLVSVCKEFHYFELSCVSGFLVALSRGTT